MPRTALICAATAALLAAIAVADQPVGLALAVMLMVMVATGIAAAVARDASGKAAASAGGRRAPVGGGASGESAASVGRRRVSRGFAALAVALAAQALLWDARWVVGIDVVAALIAGAAAAVPVGRWADVRRAVLAPFRLVYGSTAVVRGGMALGRPVVRGERAGVGVFVRGGVLAAALVAVFAALFATADSAFAEVVDVNVQVRTDTLVWRCILGLTVLASAGALARAAGVVAVSGPGQAPRWRPQRAELLIPLVAVVAVFALFVGVQLRVLFGGAGYVRQTTGLGYGDYARHGFVELLLVASLTLAVIAVAAARSRDRAVRALLGVLCVLTLVVMASAQHRLDLVEDAYGATRVRYTGHAIVIGISLAFALVLAAGLSPRVARRLPVIATALALGGVLVFSMSDPDRRIAQSAVDRAHAGKSIDVEYLSGLSADALPALEHLPHSAVSTWIADHVREHRLGRADGVAGFNVSRARAR
jgi:hypothetical protein